MSAEVYPKHSTKDYPGKLPSKIALKLKDLPLKKQSLSRIKNP